MRSIRYDMYLLTPPASSILNVLGISRDARKFINEKLLLESE